MMKKIIALFAIVLLSAGSLIARDRVCRDTSCLPETAKVMLNKYFPKGKVSHIKIDENIIKGKEYEVVLQDGCEIDFKGDGNWESVDCGHKAVPADLVLKPIRDYVAANYKKAIIVKIDKEKNGYEIELNNGIELKFDRAGNFQRIDD